MTVFYPDGYGTRMITLDEMRAKHGPKMHPEFAQRFFAWIESMGGHVGVGGGWRSSQPDKPGFAPEGKSFHQDQQFASGFVGYCAVDLVVVNPGRVHRAPFWIESATAPKYGLHTFISGEPWHIQPVEIRGWGGWVDAGRPDPMTNYPFPGTPVPKPEPEPEPEVPVVEVPDVESEIVDMVIIDLNPDTDWWVAMVLDATSVTHLVNGHHVNVLRRGGVPRVHVNETEMDGILRSVKTTNQSPFRAGIPSHNASLDTLWRAAADG